MYSSKFSRKSPIFSPDLESGSWLKFRLEFVREPPTIPLSSPFQPSPDSTLTNLSRPKSLPDRKFSRKKGGGVLATASRDAGAVPPDHGENKSASRQSSIFASVRS